MFILSIYKDVTWRSHVLPSALSMMLKGIIITITTLSIAIGDTRLGADNFGATTAFAGVIQVEAEDLELSTYLVEDNEFASGKKLISLLNSGGTSGSASGKFRGEEGEYFVVVNYMDENDGVSGLSFSLNGSKLSSWLLDQDCGVSGPEREALTAHTLGGSVRLKRGDTYTIQGEKDDDEETRVDSIQFIPVESIVEFESNSNQKNEIPGSTSGGYIDTENEGEIAWKIDTQESADYSLNFRYSYGAETPETRPLDIFVNDKLVASKLPFKSTGVDSRWLNQTVVVKLKQGMNTINTAFADDTDKKVAHIDYLSVAKVKYLNARGSAAPHHYSSRNSASIPHPSAYHPEYDEDDTYSESYYGHVDPEGKRKTFAQWKDVNGFNQSSFFEASAEYINGADLGFGRKMHCRSLPTTCYVENFLNPGTDDEVFAATVTMERMIVDGKDIVAFFVYDKDGKRMNQIGLDSEGAKSVPESCYACHGGLSHFSSVQEGGQFIPWDIALLKDWKGHKTLAEQEENFRQLNAVAWFDASNRKSEIKTLVESWYGGFPKAGDIFTLNNFQTEADKSLIPKDVSKANWFSDPKGYLALDNTAADTKIRDLYYRERSLYENVYTKYCRSCHVAQITDWTTAVDFNVAAYNHICKGRVSPIMPHAELTDDLFSNERHSFIHGDTATALEILCSQEPPKADEVVIQEGRNLFQNIVDGDGKAGGCVRCHETDDLSRHNPPEIISSDLSCKVTVKNDLASINPAMKFSLSDNEVVSIKAYLASLDSCR